jgi:hypothetical protein
LAAVDWAHLYPVQMFYHLLKMSAQGDGYLGRQQEAVHQDSSHSCSSPSKASMSVPVQAAACYQQNHCHLQEEDQTRSLLSVRSQGVMEQACPTNILDHVCRAAQPPLCTGYNHPCSSIHYLYCHASAASSYTALGATITIDYRLPCSHAKNQRSYLPGSPSFWNRPVKEDTCDYDLLPKHSCTP